MSRTISIFFTFVGAMIDIFTLATILISGLALLGVGFVIDSFWISAGLAIFSFAVGQMLNFKAGSEYQRWGAVIRDHLSKND